MKKQHPLWFRALCGFMAALTLAVSTPCTAFDVQVLPQNTQAGIGFTHRARIRYTDATNGVLYSTWRLFPASGTFAAGDAVDRVAVYVDSVFNGSLADSNTVTLNVGVTGETNAALSAFFVGSNANHRVWISNLSISNAVGAKSIFISGATNFLQASLTFTNAGIPALLTGGDLWIYWRVVRFDRLSVP